MKAIREKHKTILVLLLFTYSLLTIYPLITNKPLGSGDDRHNALMAINLSEFGVISLSNNNDPNPEPSNYREPVPVISIALAIKIFKTFGGKDFGIEDFNSAENPKTLKLINLFWGTLCLAAVWLLTKKITQSFYLGLVTTFATYFLFVSQPIVIDTLYSELPAAALIILTSWAIVGSVDGRKNIYFVFSGFFVGLLSLTKAPVFYISIALFGFFFLPALFRNQQKLMKQIGLALFAFLITVLPWMIRNYVQFEKFEVTQRGGVVLLIRAKNDLMSPEEMKGSIFYWAPGWIRQEFIREIWNFSRKDFELGGSMQRLNRDILEINKEAERNGMPEEAISFYHQARAERVKLRNYYSQLGAENPAHLADVALQREAIEIIVSNPLRHIVMTIPFTWRGIWDLSFRHLPAKLSDVLNFVLFVGLVVGMPLLAWRRKDSKLLAFILLPIAMLAFYAFFSHNIVRYTRPTYPSKIISLFILGHYLIKSRFVSSKGQTTLNL